MFLSRRHTNCNDWRSCSYDFSNLCGYIIRQDNDRFAFSAWKLLPYTMSTN